MPNRIQLPQDPKLAKQVLDNEKDRTKRDAERGWLGVVWGVSTSVPNNIAALTILILVVIGSIFSFVQDDFDKVKTLWTIFTPIITLAFGYLFGEKMHKQSHPEG